MTSNYEAFLASRSTEIAQPCTEITFVDFINHCIPESNIKYVLTALSPLLYSKVSSTNYKMVVIVRDMLEEAIKILPELTDWEWAAQSSSQFVDDITTPVGQNPKWNIPEDYPFKDEPPLLITQPGYLTSGYYLKCSPDIKAWCEAHSIDTDSFNHPCILVCNLFDCSSTFYNCKSFNQPIIIPNSVTNCDHMLAHCESFNQPITIPKFVKNCKYMFAHCKSFNQPITIPSSVTGCTEMFSHCDSLNQPVTIPDSVTNCDRMFEYCWSFNQPIDIPDSVTTRIHMFYNCVKLDRSKVIGYESGTR